MLSFHYLIVLPNDLQLRRILNVKQRQYQERMSALTQQTRSPLSGAQLDDHLYNLVRVLLISRLLRNGWVEVHDVQMDLIRGQHMSNDQEAVFFGAVAVVLDYVVFKGIHLTGGAGIPDVKP